TIAHPLGGGESLEASVISLAMVALLLLAGREFWVRSDPVTAAGGWSVMAASFAFTYLYTVAGFYLLRRHFALVTGLEDAALSAFGLLTTFTTGRAVALNREAAAFAWSACALEGAGVFAGLFMILAPTLDRRIQISGPPRVEPMLRRFGRSSPSFFALEAGMRYFFPPQSGGVVPYTWRAGVALVAGEPLCEPDRIGGACDEFLDFCEGHDWRPAFYQ